MPRSTYTDIGDERIDAYSPLTARLMTDIVENYEAVAVWSLVATGDSFEKLSGWSGSTWTTMGTQRIFIPDAAVGSNGTKLTMATTTRARQNSADSATPQVRLKYSSTEGDPITVGVGVNPTYTYDTALMVLEFTPTKNAVADILWQGYFDGAIGVPADAAIGCQWPRTSVTDSFSYGLLERID